MSTNFAIFRLFPHSLSYPQNTDFPLFFRCFFGGKVGGKGAKPIEPPQPFAIIRELYHRSVFFLTCRFPSVPVEFPYFWKRFLFLVFPISRGFPAESACVSEF
jgi:hypothetical protein